MGSLSSSTHLYTMKYLVLATCLSLSTASGFFGLVGHPNGAVVPVDEPAVAAARADHLAAKFGHGGPVIAGPAVAGPAVAAPLVAAPAIAAPAYPGYAAGYGYAGPLNLNTHLVGHPNGAVVPLDEPAVAAARADHFAAGGGRVHAAPIVAAPVVAAPLAAPIAPVVAHGYAGPLNLNTHLVAHPNGAVVPLDEPAVAAALADHFAAGGGHAEGHYAYAAAGPVAYGAGYGYGLVAHPNGAVVPVDEPAVQAARTDHFAAKGGVY